MTDVRGKRERLKRLKTFKRFLRKVNREVTLKTSDFENEKKQNSSRAFHQPNIQPLRVTRICELKGKKNNFPTSGLPSSASAYATSSRCQERRVGN